MSEVKVDAVAMAREYVKWDPFDATRNEVQKLIDENNVKELQDRFLNRISFGTAGLRAKMAGGYKYMNDLVIIQTTQGLTKYIEECTPNQKQRSAVVGYDGRHNSKRYAHLVAAVFLSRGFKVYLFSTLVATPFVPYGVKEYGASIGVMVTASHNPKDDNGYKVFWSNGAQIIPPHDKGIADSIMKNLEPWKQYVLDPKDALLEDPLKNLCGSYMDAIGKRFCFHKDENAKSIVKVTYTAMHGVGAKFVTEAFKTFNLPDYIPVKEQVDPDPDFSTVAFPNPEEGKGALALAMKTADKENSTLILANDPDADRLAVAEKNDGQWVVFNGNEIAALLADWVWTNYKKANPKADPSKSVMLASTVSSKFLQAMAKKEGFHFADTLTGFKWLGNVAIDHEAKGYNFLFAYEVEIGFLVGNLSMDKDGVRTAAIFAEMTNQIYLQKKTLYQHLQDLYKKYGYFQMNTSYYFCYARDIMDKVFAALRNDGKYVQSCGEYKINAVRDVTLGFDNSKPNNVSVLPAAPDSQMLTFYFSDGSVSTLRNSGTEPKLKYYVECSDPDSVANARKKVDDLTAAIIKEFLNPEKNQLVAPKRG